MHGPIQVIQIVGQGRQEAMGSPEPVVGTVYVGCQRNPGWSHFLYGESAGRLSLAMGTNGCSLRSQVTGGKTYVRLDR
jgi:hypothetical protein